jgi:hypothetical protein
MIATVFAVALASPTGLGGTALTVDGQPHRQAPILFALFAERARAEQRLVEAARAEWEEAFAYGQGAAVQWDDARLLRRMRDAGYLATVTEQVVEL